MTREELETHCIRQIEQIEMWAKYKGEKPSGKVYEEHKLILELLEQEQKADNEWCTDCKEYDHEKHCCPRFSQVIKTTLQECCENAVNREDVLLMLTGEDLPDDASKLISIFSERIKNLLPVKPQEPCEDAVSRAELKKWLDMNFSFGGALRKLELFDRLDKELPSVTPYEPRTGHWIDDMRLGYHVSVCSNCNWRGHGDTCLIYKPKYCPNCGADMREADEVEE